MDTLLYTIINKYFIIVNEFLCLINTSEVIKKLNNKESILFVGIDTITHIFNMMLIKVRNIDQAFHSSQKAYYCYLEYIEQIHIKLMTSELNVKDAVMFLYNKSFITDYLEYNEQNDEFKDKVEMDYIVDNIIKFKAVVNALLYFGDNFEDKKTIIESFLLKYLLLCVDKDYLIYNINVITSYIKIEYETAIVFLEEYYNSVSKKNVKHINGVALKNLTDLDKSASRDKQWCKILIKTILY
mgnify:CR=1 FL=1